MFVNIIICVFWSLTPMTTGVNPHPIIIKGVWVVGVLLIWILSAESDLQFFLLMLDPILHSYNLYVLGLSLVYH